MVNLIKLLKAKTVGFFLFNCMKIKVNICNKDSYLNSLEKIYF